MKVPPAYLAAGALALIVFGGAAMAALGAPIPDDQMSLLTGLTLGGGAGAGGTYALMRKPPVVSE